MLGFLKDYYVFMLILLVFSYLVPKEDYKVYIQFFIGIFVIVLLLKPILEILTIDDPTLIYDVFQEVNEQLDKYVFFKGEGE